MWRIREAEVTREPWWPWALDGVFALALTVFVVIASLVSPLQSGGAPLDGVGIAILVLAGMSIAVRRRAPVAAAVVTVACAVAYYAATYPGIFADTPAVIAGYTLVTAGRHRTAVLAGVVLCTGILAVGLLPGRDPAGATTGALWIVGFWVAFMIAGRLAFHREAYVRAVEERTAEAERTREEHARRRAGEERLRIARDLHDSLTHTISVITVQAGVAQHLADRSPRQVRESLAVITEAGRDGMEQLRSTLGVLYEQGGVPAADTQPAASTLDDLPSLLGRTEAAGTPVRYRRDSGVDVPRHVSTAAYHIVRESLANVARHAPGTAADVTVRIDGRVLVLAVTNPTASRSHEDDPTIRDAPGHSTAAPPVSGGHKGIDNMRSRAAALGGSLRAGTGPDGDFLVEARLPLDHRPAAAGWLDSPA